MRLDDACDILGIDRVRHPGSSQPRITSTLEEAQKKYRKLALLHHPDRSSDPGATAKFQTIGEAWERVQDYHNKGFGFEVTLEEPLRQPQRDARSSSRFSDYFSSWFGSGRVYDEEGYATQCAAGCECNFCRVDRARKERAERHAKEVAAKQKKAQEEWARESVKKKAAQEEWAAVNARERRAAEDEARANAAARQAERIAEEERLSEEATRAKEAQAEKKREREKAAKALKKARARLRSACREAVVGDEDELSVLCLGLSQASVRAARCRHAMHLLSHACSTRGSSRFEGTP